MYGLYQTNMVLVARLHQPSMTKYREANKVEWLLHEEQHLA